MSARRLALGTLLLVVLVIAALVRLASESAPTLGIHRTLASYARLPGGRPVLAWPREGEAAVEVEGIGVPATAGGSTPVPIASVAKVMTAYLTLREHPLTPGEEGFTITVTPAEAAEEEQRADLGESVLPVTAGERITERQALEALLLPSANNIAAMLAAYDAGDVAAFLLRMNATARALDMTSTSYTDPSGFKDSTVSTAADQLKLARAAIGLQALAAIADERTVDLPGVGTVSNLNGLLGSDGYVGVKTGSDRAGGGCLMFAKRVDVAGRIVTILGVVLGQRRGSLIGAALSAARRLGDSVASSLHMVTALPAGTRVLSAYSPDGRRTAAVTAGPLEELGWGGLELPVAVLSRPPASRVRRGEVLARVRIGGPLGASTPAIAVGSIGDPGLGWRLRHLL
jgi:D-alanyl-D-alanine carboxypeptidase (penicillin-binding protein 5/6)